MEKEKINPISGEQFEDFLLLTDPKEKSSKIKLAWQALQQQINSHNSSSQLVDLNRICVDMIKMELLIFPVVEHWKRPLTNAEWAYIDKEAIQLENQMEKMKKLSGLVRKKDPLAFPSISPLFNKLLQINKELRSNWESFKRSWSEYKKDWQHFQSRKKQLLNKKQEKPKSHQNNIQKDSHEEQGIEPPISPPMFSRDRWHALRVSSKALETELLHQCQHFRNGTKNDHENLEGGVHPAINFLVEELRKIYLKTHGFELIDRVKLIQERNDQLMQELQPFFPEPIITAKMLAETKPSQKTRYASKNKNKNKKTSKLKFSRKTIFIIFLITILLCALTIFIFEKQNINLNKNIIKHLKFVPKNKTLTAKSSAKDKLSELNLEDMMKDFGSEIPVQESNELLKKMITATPEILENITNRILNEIGENTVFVFSEAQAFYLFWKGKLEKFLSPDDLKKKLAELERQYKGIESLWEKMGNNAPEDLRIVPDVLDGKSTFAMEMLDENGDPLKVYMTDEGIVLRLNNGKLLDKPLSIAEASKKISSF